MILLDLSIRPKLPRNILILFIVLQTYSDEGLQEVRFQRHLVLEKGFTHVFQLFEHAQNLVIFIIVLVHIVDVDRLVMLEDLHSYEFNLLIIWNIDVAALLREEQVSIFQIDVVKVYII